MAWIVFKRFLYNVKKKCRKGVARLPLHPLPWNPSPSTSINPAQSWRLEDVTRLTLACLCLRELSAWSNLREPRLRPSLPLPIVPLGQLCSQMYYKQRANFLAAFMQLVYSIVLEVSDWLFSAGQRLRDLVLLAPTHFLLSSTSSTHLGISAVAFTSHFDENFLQAWYKIDLSPQPSCGVPHLQQHLPWRQR